MEFLIEKKRALIKKGTILLREGEICRTVYKVISGCLKSYVIDPTGKQHLLQFAPEDWYISDLDSFTTHKPARLFIEAVEDSVCIHLAKPDSEVVDIEALIQLNYKFLQNIISTNKRLMALLSLTAEDRYKEFADTYPSLLQRLPLKLIASYIGITPEYLSELRKKS